MSLLKVKYTVPVNDERFHMRVIVLGQGLADEPEMSEGHFEVFILERNLGAWKARHPEYVIVDAR